MRTQCGSDSAAVLRNLNRLFKPGVGLELNEHPGTPWVYLYDVNAQVGDLHRAPFLRAPCIFRQLVPPAVRTAFTRWGSIRNSSAAS